MHFNQRQYSLGNLGKLEYIVLFVIKVHTYFLRKDFFFCFYVHCLVCASVPDPLKPELQMVVSSHADAGK